MFIHTHVSAPKRFSKCGRQKQTFYGKKEEKALSQTQVRRTIAGVVRTGYANDAWV